MTGPIAQQTEGGTYVQRGGSSSGLDVRVVVASVDAYLRFAEAVNRLDIAHDGTSQGLPQFVEGMQESGAKRKTRGVLEGAQEHLKETFTGDGDSDGGSASASASGAGSGGESRPARRRSSRKKEDDE